MQWDRSWYPKLAKTNRIEAARSAAEDSSVCIYIYILDILAYALPMHCYTLPMHCAVLGAAEALDVRWYLGQDDALGSVDLCEWVSLLLGEGIKGCNGQYRQCICIVGHIYIYMCAVYL